MAWNTWLTIGMVMLAIGVILFIIGIVWYEINIRNRTVQNTWTYVFLFGGAAIGAIGCCMIAAGLIQSDNESKTKTTVVVGQPEIYVPNYHYSPPPTQRAPLPEYQQQAPVQKVQLPPVVVSEDNMTLGPVAPSASKNQYYPASTDTGFRTVQPPPAMNPDYKQQTVTDNQYTTTKMRPSESNYNYIDRYSIPRDIGYKPDDKYLDTRLYPVDKVQLPPVIVNPPVIEDDPEKWE